MSHAIRLAYRRLTGRKLVSAVIVLCLALGIGANTAIFSVINRLLLQPLPLEEVERVVFTLTMRTEDDPFEASLLDATAFRTQAHSFSDVGLGRYETFTVYGLERPERLAGASISYDYLTTLRVKAALGRAFQPEDDRPGAAPVAMLSQSAWKSRFGGDPSIVGRSLNLDNRHYTVVGILPEGFDLPLRTQVWVPLATDIETAPLKERTAHKYFLVARLRPGVTLEQANDEARGIARGIAEAHPEHRKGWGIKLIPLRQQLLGDITGNIRPTLLVLMGIVGFLLLITCANVASLLLVRSLERMHETAVQLALGASHRRLVLQLMTESVMLSLAGGAAGLLLAFVVTKLLMTLRPIQFFAMGEAFQSVQMDGSVLLFAFAVSLLTGIVFGLAPALWTSSAGGLNHFLKEGGQRGGVGRRGRRLFEALMVAEVAVATLLLFGAGLMVKSFQRLSDAKLGFRPDNLMAMEMHLSESDYPQHAQRQQFTGRVLERVRSMPGVSAAGMTTNIPVSVSSRDSKYTVEGQQGRDASESPITSHRLVTAGYLETLGVTLLRGRLIEEQDQANTQPVVVVSKEFAGREWPGQEALGKRVKPGNPAAPTTPWYTVVGVVDDVKEDRFNFRNDRPVWYLPYAQVENRLPVTLLLRSAGDPSALAASVRAEIGAMNPNQPVTEVGTLEGQLADFLGPQRFTALLSSLFAVVGLFLAVVGIYGVTAYSVIQRTREFSVRIAFGAGWRDLVRLVVGRGLRLAVVGLVLGSLGGLALGRLLSSLLYQVRPTAPEIIILPASILLFVVLLAIYLPLRKVARLNPVEGLRHE
ncbi:MAG TPA: ABC transporter permease [Pyrinomonadaceae bacterium]|nr:ABC transporter permease [Pyrinomonadaceae bacterium]